MLINGYLLFGPKRNQLLTHYPTWVELLRNYDRDIEAYDETRKSLNTYRWALENAGHMSFRITTTVDSELKVLQLISVVCGNLLDVCPS